MPHKPIVTRRLGIPQEAAKLARTRSWAYADSVQGFQRRQSLQSLSHSLSASMHLPQPDGVPNKPLQPSTQQTRRPSTAAGSRGATTRFRGADQQTATAPQTMAGPRGGHVTWDRRTGVRNADPGHIRPLSLTKSGRPLRSGSSAASQNRPYSAPQSPSVGPLGTAKRSSSRSPRIGAANVNRAAGPSPRSAQRLSPDRQLAAKQQFLQKLACEGSGRDLKAGLGTASSQLIVAACPDLRVRRILACPAYMLVPIPMEALEWLAHEGWHVSTYTVI